MAVPLSRLSGLIAVALLAVAAGGGLPHRVAPAPARTKPTTGASAPPVALPSVGDERTGREPPPASSDTVDRMCSSDTHTALAAALSKDIADALSEREGVVAVALADPGTGVSCGRNADERFESASVVKVAIMGAVLRRAMDEQRDLSTGEKGGLQRMITESDNASAQRLWDGLGTRRFQSFLTLAGMVNTVPGPGSTWGLSQITAADQLRLADVYTGEPGVLSAEAQAYGLDLMSRVVPDQRWGTPAGASGDVTVYVKNGWLPRAHGWVVHSLGIFTTSTRTYQLAVLTRGSRTMGYGVDTIERVAGVVHRDLQLP